MRNVRTYGPTAVYLIKVLPGLDDNTAYPSASTGTQHTLGTVYYNTFTIPNQSPPPNTSPLTILQEAPANNSFTASTIGYAKVTMTESVNPESLGPYSVTLIPRNGGLDLGNFDPADRPLNAVVTFNPNMNQFVIVPTVPLGSDVYLYTLTTPMSATNGDVLSNAPLYASFQLGVSQNVSFVMVRHHAALAAPTPVTGSAGASPTRSDSIAVPTAASSASSADSKPGHTAQGRHRPRPAQAITPRLHDLAVEHLIAARPPATQARRLAR